MKTPASDFRTVADIVKVMRPRIAAGGFFAFCLGVLLGALENQVFNTTRIALGYLVVCLSDLSTHYSNDYFDARLTRARDRQKIFGGSDVLIRRPELRPLTLRIAVILTAISIVLAAVSVFLYGAPSELLLMTAAGNLLGWIYSAPPIRLSSRGLGEIAIAVGVGLGIPGAGYLVTKGRFDSLFLSLAIPFMMYGFVLSLSLEIPDMEDDLQAGKKTLVVRKGRSFSFLAVMALSSLATLSFFIYSTVAASLQIINLKVVTVLSSIPLATGITGFVKRREKREQADPLSAANIVALFLFNISTDLYLATLLICSRP